MNLDMIYQIDFVDIETAEQRFAEYMEEYECAVMYKVSEHGLEVVKSESDFQNLKLIK